MSYRNDIRTRKQGLPTKEKKCNQESRTPTSVRDMRALLSTVQAYNSPEVINTAQAADNCLKRNITFTLTVFIEWKQSLKFTYVTIFDIDKA